MLTNNNYNQNMMNINNNFKSDMINNNINQYQNININNNFSLDKNNNNLNQCMNINKNENFINQNNMMKNNMNNNFNPNLLMMNDYLKQNNINLNNNLNQNIMNMNNSSNNFNQNMMINNTNGNNIFNQNLMINNNNYNQNLMINDNNSFNQNKMINNNILNNNFNATNNVHIPQMLQMSDLENEEWLKAFQLGVDEVNLPRLKVRFKTTQGVDNNITVEYGTTIDQLLKKYLTIQKREYLIEYESHNIVFLFNAKQIKLGDKTKVEQFFKNIINPMVVVNDVNYLIEGKEKNITFIFKKVFSFNYAEGQLIDDLLKYFFKLIGKEKYKNNKNITFVFEERLIKSKDLKNTVGDFFKYSDFPQITVNDPKNLL